MSRWPLILYLACCGAGCGGKAAATDAGPDGPDDAGAPVIPDAAVVDGDPITVSPTAFTFPDVAPGQNSTPVVFTMMNTDLQSTGPISVVIEGSDFFISASTCGPPLPFRAICKATVVFRPTTFGLKMGRLIFAAETGRFTALLAGPSLAPPSVQLHPSYFQFRTTTPPTAGIPASELETTFFSVTNLARKTLGRVLVQLRGEGASQYALGANSCGEMLPASAHCTFAVRFQPTTPGPKLATVEVNADGLTASAYLNGAGQEPARLAVWPPDRQGVVFHGHPTEFSFQISNTGNSHSGKVSATVQGMHASEFSAALEPACARGLLPGASCDVTVTFTAPSLGDRSATLLVEAMPGGSATARLNPSVHSPMRGSLTVTPPAPDPFGTVMVGDSRSRRFVVTNQGTTAAGQVFTDFGDQYVRPFSVTDNDCPASLAGGTSCGLTITFAPTFPGRRTANLHVSAAPDNFVGLVLVGHGTAAEGLSFTPDNNGRFDKCPVGFGIFHEFQVRFSSGPDARSGPLTVEVEGKDAPTFQMVLNDCQSATLVESGLACRVGLRFAPVSKGEKTATLVISANPGGVLRIPLSGTGV